MQSTTVKRGGASGDLGTWNQRPELRGPGVSRSRTRVCGCRTTPSTAYAHPLRFSTTCLYTPQPLGLSTTTWSCRSTPYAVSVPHGAQRVRMEVEACT
eukprot:1441812-Rhodomonas_salina.1